MLNDAALELPLIRLLEDLAPCLLDATFEGGNYCEAYMGLTLVLDDAVEQSGKRGVDGPGSRIHPQHDLFDAIDR